MGSELRQRGVQSQSDDANKTAPAVAEAPPPNPIAPMFKVGWWVSNFALCQLSLFGTLFTLKSFGDPVFSDWMRPGPGHPLLGDAGRMLMYEAGPNGVQSLLLGGTLLPAWLIEGTLLGLGTLGIYAAWCPHRLTSLFTAYTVPLEGAYYLLMVVYFPIVGAPELALPMFLLGSVLILISVIRVVWYTPDTDGWHKEYFTYLKNLMAAVLLGWLFVYAQAGRYQDKIALFIRVREHFIEVNRMSWTKGLEYPDGFVP